MSTPNRMKEASSESRCRILDAAEILFAEQGVAETSLAEVAARSGISRGSIPWHFTNKTGLLMAVVERATTREHSPPMTPGLDGLDTNVAGIAKSLRKPHMALLHTLLSEAGKPDSTIRDAYAAYHEQDRAELLSWLIDSPDLNIPNIDTDQLSALIFAMVIGINVQWRIAPEKVPLDDTLQGMARLLRAASHTDEQSTE